MEKEQDSEYQQVRWYQVTEQELDQRIDNFLLRLLKGVPKSLVYRIIRKGEVRVNKSRVKPEYKLALQDVIRIPPIRIAQAQQEQPNPKLQKIQQLEQAILYEDKDFLAINKPSGLAVHGGSGLSYGLIEGLRSLRPHYAYLELVHRLDRDTSGILLVAKKRQALLQLQEQLKNKTMKKIYLALVGGRWPQQIKKCQEPLLRITLKSGERVVRPSPDGKASLTIFRLREQFRQAALIEASPITGRTHQIRVHTFAVGQPILGDAKYNNEWSRKLTADLQVERLFLHAANLTFQHPRTQQEIFLEAPLPLELVKIIKNI